MKNDQEKNCETVSHCKPPCSGTKTGYKVSVGIIAIANCFYLFIWTQAIPTLCPLLIIEAQVQVCKWTLYLLVSVKLLLLYSFLAAIGFMFFSESASWIRKCLFDLFVLEGVLEITVYSLFSNWLVNSTACEDGNQVCEAIHDMNIVQLWFKWIVLYFPFKVICAGLLHNFSTNNDAFYLKLEYASEDEEGQDYVYFPKNCNRMTSDEEDPLLLANSVTV